MENEKNLFSNVQYYLINSNCQNVVGFLNKKKIILFLNKLHSVLFLRLKNYSIQKELVKKII
jgi:hypothetical protein